MPSTMAIQDTLTVLGVDSQDITDIGAALAVLAVEAAKAIKPLDQFTQAFENVQANISTTVAGVAEVGRVAQTVGLSTKALQEYRFAAEKVGVASADLDEIMKRLAVSVGQARLDSAERQGGAVNTAKGNSSDNLEEAIADFQKLMDDAGDDAQKALAIATAIFGDLGDEAIALFRLLDPEGLAEMRRSASDNNLVHDQELIDNAAAAQAEFAELGARIDAAAARGTIEGATVIIENLEKLLDRFAEFENASPEEQRRRTANALEAKEADAANIEQRRDEKLKDIDDVEAKVFRNQEDLDAVREGVAAWQGDVSDLTVELIGVNKEIIALKQTLEQISQITPEANDAIGRTSGVPPVDSSETERASNSSQLSIFGVHGFASGGTLRSGQLGIVGEAGPEFAIHTPFGTEITPMSNAGSTRGRGIGGFGASGGGRLLSGLSAGGCDELSLPFVLAMDALDEWKQHVTDGVAEISNDSLPTFGKAVEENVVQPVAQVAEEAEESFGELRQLFDDVAGRAIDRLGDEIVELSLDFESLKEIGKAALQELIKGVQDLLQEMLRAEVISPAKSAAKDVASDVFSSIFTSFFAGGFQHGGTIPRGQFGVVGEAGPELAFASGQGVAVVPPRSPSLSAFGPRGGGGANVVVNQSFDFRNADETTVGRLAVMAETIKRESIAMAVQAVRSEALAGGGFAKDLGKRA